MIIGNRVRNGSARGGVEHVFWPFPDDFGVSQTRVSGEDAEELR